MVKGLSRRVIVLDAPDPDYFEQAIFIVRNDAAGEGVSAHELVSEARRIAGGDCTGGKPVPRKKYLPIVTALLGGGIVGLFWLLSILV